MASVKIEGMSCQHCVGAVKDAIEALTGVSSVVVDLEKGEATYQGDVDPVAVAQVVTSIGFEVVSK